MEVLLDGCWVPGVAVQVSADGQRVKVRRPDARQDPADHWQDADVVRARSGPASQEAEPGTAQPDNARIDATDATDGR